MQEGNCLNEAHLITHFAHVCLQEHFSVYPEAASNGGADRRIDLLVYCPKQRMQIRTEAKRLYSLEKAMGIVQDSEKIKTFQPNAKDNEGADILNPDCVAALYLAVTHYSDTAKHWRDLEQAPHSSEELSSLLHECGEQRGALPIQYWFPDNFHPWLLYAWHLL
jgi:hypothetical protein